MLLSKAIDGVSGLTVYVGDSASDLSPLLAADVGIIVGQNKTLRRVAAAAGIAIKPLAAGQTVQPRLLEPCVLLLLCITVRICTPGRGGEQEINCICAGRLVMCQRTQSVPMEQQPDV